MNMQAPVKFQRASGKPRFLALLLALPSWASVAPTNVQVTGGTATTEIIEYNCPSSPNLMEASEGSAIGTLIHDVDPSLGGEFAGWNLDTRPGSLVHGARHTFVFGQHDAARRAYLGGDGRTYYSAALQAYTLHTFRITCGPGPADAESYSGSFTTKNIPAGNTYTFPAAVNDPHHPGV